MQFYCLFMTSYNTLGYPVIIISKVIDISCNGRRNVLLTILLISSLIL